MATERVDVEVREDGSRVVQRSLEDVARSAEVAAASLDLMKSALNTIQGTVKQPTASLQQMRAAIAALQATARSPGGLLDVNNINFATAALDRLLASTNTFAKEAPEKVQAAIGRINMAVGAMSTQMTKAVEAQSLAAAVAAKATPRADPVQMGFAFSKDPMVLQGAGWQLEGTFKKVADSASEARGTIASIAAPTQQFAQVAKTAASSAQQLNLNLGAANQTSFAFMNGMAAQRAPVNALASQYQTVGTVWSKNTQQAQQLAFGFMNTARGANAAGAAASAAVAPVNSLASSFFNLQNIMRTMVAYLFLRQIKDYIDTWIGATNMINLYTSSAGESIEVQKRMFAVAQETRQEYGTLAQLYQRTAQAAGNLGASQNEMIQFTKQVGQALVVQNRSATQAAGALLQLGQLVGMARIRMQEFNSISENMPIVLQVVARNITAAGGSIARLRDLIMHGKVSSSQFFHAFLRGSEEMQTAFDRIKPTITQAFTVLDNAIGRYIFQSDQGMGASTAFARAVIFLADHIDVLAKSILALGTGILIAALPALMSKLIGVAATADAAATGLRGLYAAAMAHPIAMLVALITAATVALYTFRDSIVLVQDQSITLGDVFRSVFQQIANNAAIVRDFISNLWNAGSTEETDPILKNLKKGDDQWQGYIVQQQTNVSVLQSIFTGFAEWFRLKMTNLIMPFFILKETIPIVWAGMWSAIKDITISTINSEIERLQKWVDRVLLVVNLLDRLQHPLAHKDLEIKLPQLENPDAGKAAQLGQDLADGVARGMSKATQHVDNFFRSIQENARFRQFQAAGGLLRPPDLNQRTPLIPGPNANQKEIDKLTKKLEHLHSVIDPAWGALHHVEEAEKDLNQAIALGIPLWDTKENIMKAVQAHYEDSIHPVEAHIRKLEEELDINRQMRLDRTADMDTLRQIQTLKKRDPHITEEQINKIKELNRTLREEQATMRLQDRLYDKYVLPRKSLAAGIAALDAALKKGEMSVLQYRLELAKLRIDAGQGTFADGFIANLESMRLATTTAVAEIGGMFANLADKMIGGFADAFARMIVYGDNFGDALKAAAREGLAALISGLIRLGAQMLVNFALGQGLKAAELATTTAAATATAAAWAPAAAMASLASFGANAIPAQAGITSTVGLAQLMAFGGMKFAHGGEFTVGGGGGTDSQLVAFRATPGENVRINTPAQGQAAERSAAPVLNVTIENHVGANIQVKRISETEVRVIAREEARAAVRTEAPLVVAHQIRNPNSHVSSALSSSTDVQRRRGR